MVAHEIALDKLIELTPGVLGGKPRIAGRRIRVIDVAFWHETLGLSADTIASKYELSLAEVHAALAYYHAHREALEADARADEALVAEMKQRFPGRWLQTPHA